MNILVTGAKGMVGTALVNNLKNIRDGKNRTRPIRRIQVTADLLNAAKMPGRIICKETFQPLLNLFTN